MSVNTLYKGGGGGGGCRGGSGDDYDDDDDDDDDYNSKYKYRNDDESKEFCERTVRAGACLLIGSTRCSLL
jgi:hypothetical protein